MNPLGPLINKGIFSKIDTFPHFSNPLSFHKSPVFGVFLFSIFPFDPLFDPLTLAQAGVFFFCPCRERLLEGELTLPAFSCWTSAAAQANRLTVSISTFSAPMGAHRTPCPAFRPNPQPSPRGGAPPPHHRATMHAHVRV